MKSKYQVINTFDSEKANYGYCPRFIEPGCTVDFFMERPDEHYDYVRPNAPIPAKATLLARRLMKGLPTVGDAGYIKNYRENRRRREETVRKSIKKMPEFEGKLVSAEIEFYPLPRPRSESEGNFSDELRTLKGDGSLDYVTGREMNKMSWVNTKTGRLEGILALNLKGEVDRKCGLHIHVDVRHLKPISVNYDPARLSPLKTYFKLLKYQKFLKRLVTRDRIVGTFCKFKVNGNARPDGSWLGSRYCAINWQSFREHGTIEFRCWDSTLNMAKVEMTALLCQHLVNHAAYEANPVPGTWSAFLAILPEPMRSWVAMRAEQLKAEQTIDRNNRVAESLRA